MSEPELTSAERLMGAAARALGRLPGWLQLILSGRPQLVIDNQRLAPCLQLMLKLTRARTRYGLAEPNPVEARARFHRETIIFDGPKTPVDVREDVDITYRNATHKDVTLRARRYSPPRSATGDDDGGGRSRELLVYLHGGGFVIGDLDTHDEVCRLLCLHADTHVLSVEYRLASEHPYDYALQDARAALVWAQAHAEEFGADPARVSLGGDSAGGNLTAVVAQMSASDGRMNASEGRMSESKGRPPAAQMLIYPATDGSEAARSRPSRKLFAEGLFFTQADYEAFIHYYTDGTDVKDDDPRVSPLCANDFSGLPPALVVTAGFDLLRDEGLAYADALERAGNTVARIHLPAFAHGFINMTGVCPCARREVIRIAKEWRVLLDKTRRETRQDEALRVSREDEALNVLR
ncbi:MAG: acetyl esterase [Acidobacteriota bacterium]|jgi:acetyl esterase|nr:acetyl esterase [Acidobacteriota bacterium]